MKIHLQNDELELEITLLVNGTVIIRDNGVHLGAGKWHREENELEIDLPPTLRIRDSANPDPNELVFQLALND